MTTSSKKRTKKSQSTELSTPPPPQIKAYGYARVSTEEQAREGLSLPAQEEKIRAYAVIHNLNLIEIIRDDGYSGKNINRPGLQRLLEMIQSPEPEAVIVWKLDRLTRSTRDLLALVEERFKTGNTRFLSITEQIDTDTAMGKFFLTLMGAMAQMERELISERTSAALSHKKDRGDTLGQVPYGWSRVDNRLVKNADEQEVLKQIKQMRRNGLSFRHIARALNAQNIPTRRSKSKSEWRASTIHHLLNRDS